MTDTQKATGRSQIRKKRRLKDDIAIIGIGCRFPDANDHLQFWENLNRGVNSIKTITPDRWDINEYYSADFNEPNKSQSKWCGLIQDIDLFDNRFFNISPREAKNMDPQQRLLLEETWHCIEDSGVLLSTLQEKITSVYIGVMATDYQQAMSARHVSVDSYAALGNYSSILANRLSHSFGFQGQSVSIDAACASSLVAIHQARQSLLNAESDYAIAGGVSLNLHPWKYISFSKARMLSPEGQCKTFDAAADGYVPGEGVGVVLMQPLAEAKRQGNHVYGVIKGSAVNHCGKTLSITAPLVEAQKNVILSAYEDAAIHPETVTYTEAHGTGTSLGDPIEIESLAKAFAVHTGKKGFCKIGSVKTNIGHLEAAAGIAGVIKVLMMMRNRTVPKTLNLKRVNPIIRFEDSPFKIAHASSTWQSSHKGLPLRAGVSSLGMGGVNSHILLEEHIARRLKPEDDPPRPHLFVLSAKQWSSLEKSIAAWKTFVKGEIFGSHGLKDICATLSAGRQAFHYRYGALIENKAQLKKILSGRAKSAVIQPQEKWCLRIGEFSFQGSDEIRKLGELNVLFRQKLNGIRAEMKKLEWPKSLITGFSKKKWPAAKIPLYSFMAGYAFIRMMIDSGFKPHSITGEKSGLWIALVLSGVADLSSVLTFLAGKSDITQIRLRRPSIPFWDPDRASAYMPFDFNAGDVSTMIKAVTPSKNHPWLDEHIVGIYVDKARLLVDRQFTFTKYLKEWDAALAPSGHNVLQMIEDDHLRTASRESGNRSRLLLLVIILSALHRLNKKWHLTEPRIITHKPFHELMALVDHTVMPKEIVVDLLSSDKPDYDAAAKILNQRQVHLNPDHRFEFMKSRKTLAEISDIPTWIAKMTTRPAGPDFSEKTGYWEIGKFGQKAPAQNAIQTEMSQDLVTRFCEYLLQLWLQGFDMKLDCIYPAGSFHKVSLPVYPFEGKSFWLPPRKTEPETPVHESDMSSPKITGQYLCSRTDQIIQDHIITGKHIIPAAYMLSLVADSIQKTWHKPLRRFQKVIIHSPGIVDNPLTVKSEIDARQFKLSTKSAGLCTGELSTMAASPAPMVAPFDLSPKKNGSCRQIYRRLHQAGYQYGKGLQVLKRRWMVQDRYLFELKGPVIATDGRFYLEPAVLDGVFQSMLAAAMLKGLFAEQDHLYIPYITQSFDIYASLMGRCFVSISKTDIAQKGPELLAGARVYNHHGHCAAQIKGMRFKRVPLDFLTRSRTALSQAETAVARQTAAACRPEKTATALPATGHVYYYAPGWSQQAPPEPAVQGTPRQAIVFSIDNSFSDKLGGQLEKTYPSISFIQKSEVLDQGYLKALERRLDKTKDRIADIFWLWGYAPEVRAVSTVDALADIQDEVIFGLSQLAADLTRLKRPANIVIPTIDAFVIEPKDKGSGYALGGLSGLARTMMIENPVIGIKIVDFDKDDPQNSSDLITEAACPDRIEVVGYRHKTRYLRTVRSISPDRSHETSVWKDGGVYLLIGGLGGLGRHIAPAISRNLNVKLVLCGRSPLDPQKRKIIEDLGTLGSEVVYYPTDVTNQDQVRLLIKTVKDRFGALNGVIHSAGILDDKLLISKDRESFQKVMASKVLGAWIVNQITRSEDLDFFAVFSSIVALVGNPGQADYAAANSFLDAFMHFRAQNEFPGRSISFNWTLWSDGGMGSDPRTRHNFRGRGLDPILTRAGIFAFNQILHHPGLPQVVVSGSKITAFAKPEDKGEKTEAPESKPSEKARDPKMLEAYILDLIARKIDTTPSQIDKDESFFELGVESVALMDIMAELEKTYDHLSPTLLFEHTNTRELVDFLKDRPLKDGTGIPKPDDIPLQDPDAMEHMPTEVVHSPWGGHPPHASNAKETVPSPLPRIRQTAVSRGNGYEIAIIGMSGRFPEAPDIETYWRNLLSGKDCIKEIPRERWDHMAYFNPDPNHPHTAYAKWGGFIEDVDKFDPQFFNISPREAEEMDPQQRLLLECTWHTMEHAGYGIKKLWKNKTVGLYVGIMWNEYSQIGTREGFMQDRYVGPGSLYWAIANRVSYFMGFTGPSLAIDTACSSSLTALHLACQGILNNECEMAVAGGVNLSIHPEKYIYLSQAKFLATDGRCRSFGKDGDGYVPGEGVGMVLLKPLKKALQDRDHIWGICRGSSINHGGKAAGFTVPNPEAHTRLIIDAMQTANVSPGEIGYVECHGTGTSLGDPIEIQGLTKAFDQKKPAPQSCPIGSVKSNIGHLEAAAGIAAVIKVLLCMRHNTIPMSLHSEALNPAIDFTKSPFYVAKRNMDWPAQPNHARLAGVSSFGAGGANAHAILQAFDQEISTAQQTPQEKPAIFVLSAANRPRLEAYAGKLADFLEADPDLNLNDVADNLQTGRQAMAERFAMVSADRSKLIQGLRDFSVGRIKNADIFTGNVKTDKVKTEYLLEGEAGREFIKSVVGGKRLDKIGQLWVSGADIDWQTLHNEGPSRKISLPGYPFERQRFWIPEAGPKTAARPAAAGNDAIHPLLHKNTSDFFGQRFSTTFTGREFFLADHVVNGTRVLPGVAYLEMARAAVEKSAGLLENEQHRIILKNVVWTRPVAVRENPVRLHIGLLPEESGEIAYEIYSEPEDVDAGYSVHGQGKALLQPVSEIPVLDIAALKSRCRHRVLSSAQCYDRFKAMGLDYGPAHRGIEKVYANSNQVLARLSLPDSLQETKEQFVLHPSLTDAALQASIGLMPFAADAERDGGLKPALPFELEELEILSGSTPKMWAHIRDNHGGKIQKLDIDLCDETGRICARMKGFSSRVLKKDLKAGTATPMLTAVWEAFVPEKGSLFPSPTDRIIMVGGTDQTRNRVKQRYPRIHVVEITSGDDSRATLVEKLEAVGAIDHILWIAPHDALPSATRQTLINDQNTGVISVFRMIKALLALGYADRELGWSLMTFQTQAVYKNDPLNPTHAAIHGLIGSMAKEYPHWKIRLVDVEKDGDPSFADIFALPADSRGNALAYRDKQWHRQQLIPVRELMPQTDQKLYRSEGVYVVIGGAGGIGTVWSEYMIRNYRAQIIWIGRREQDATIAAKLDSLAALGSPPRYISADATDQTSLKQAYEEIKKDYSQINGVIHSAIILSDKSLAKMHEEQFRASLGAKVDVSVNIARIFAKASLDFVLFFSSMQTFLKAPGQSNYAAGCTFKDAFAHRLSQEWSCAVKVMNWGFWGSVGVVSSDIYKERMAKAGIGSIEVPEAMAALEALLEGPLDQLALFKTTKPDVVPELNSGESMVVYPANLPSTVKSVQRCHIEDSEPGIPWPEISSKRPVNQEENTHWQEMEKLLTELLWGQLQSIGMFNKEKFTLADLKQKYGIAGHYERWLEESVSFLGRSKRLGYAGKSYAVLDPTTETLHRLWQRWDQQKKSWLQKPALKAQVVLVEATMRALPDMLTGKTPATDIMFPESSMALVEGIYRNNPIADYFNASLADTLAAYVQERIRNDAAVRIRILEIGAGVGSASAAVFKKLATDHRHIDQYCYTDISKAFLMHAEKEYGKKNPFLTCKIFDVEKPIAEQSMDEGGYDIVIAANVLHATKNIRRTVRNTKATLKNNGLLFLNEISGNSLFLHLTFGLLKGWWLYEDEKLRIPGCPALAPEKWRMVLESEGFRSIFFPVEQAHDLGQQIIVAQSDGIVRQAQMKPGAAPVKKSTKAPAVQAPAGKPVAIAPGKEPEQGLLREKTTAYIKKLIGETLKLPSHKIDSSAPLEEYGMDSILSVELTNTLRKSFDNISSTLFFENQTVDELVQHFITTRKDTLITVLGEDNPEPSFDKGAHPETLTDARPLAAGMTFRKSIRLSRFYDPATKASESQAFKGRDIAVIGISGRYPLAETVQEFWQNLKDGRNCITQIPGERWDWRKYVDEKREIAGTSYTKWGGFIRDVDKFDPLFFRISPMEAESMDPQERLFLQTAYNGIEDAGYTPATLHEKRKIGVFAGVMNGNYPTGPNYSSIANRISYFMNFQGPSMAVDTACSSSLTAIHLALESLYNNTCECAIAGGVNLIVDPVHYSKLSAMTMLSASDKNKSFGAGADGFVVGEGVGVMVLKPLHRAIEDRDHIYAVIKGSMVNAGGKTNGYTVPNPMAQAKLISEAFQRADIDAGTVSYIEAHGTGTSLGDPIEIAGLTRAFRQFTRNRQFCAIGSVKSNIGHLEAAAGIAGVTKIISQMQNKKLVASLHCDELNPEIDFESSPFVVQQELAEWKRPIIEGKEIPRRAGISSFGAGGANAHLIIEEYERAPSERQSGKSVPGNHPHIIVLSAQNEDRLKAQANRLLAEIQTRRFSDKHLADMAYTLQVGREDMENRLAMIVTSVKELEQKLTGFSEGRKDIEALYQGRVKRNKEIMAVFTEDEDLQKAIEAWTAKGKYTQFLDLWVKGLPVDWNKFYGDAKPYRISLPTYPFAKERYWISRSPVTDLPASHVASAAEIHPLVHLNTSDFSEQRFSSTFTGREFFLADHVVNGTRVLPGVAYLEMARTAVEKSAGLRKNEQHRIILKNVVWTRPVAVRENPVRLHIGLLPEESGEIAYEIYSEPEDVDAGYAVHGQGKALLQPVSEIPVLDIAALKSRCNHRVLSSAQCYDRFKAMGLDYGPAHRGIEKVYANSNQVLARLSLPDSLRETKEQFVLHPSLTDAALQASIGLMPVTGDAERDGDLKPALPFELEELEILSGCTPKMWAHIRDNHGGKVQKLDIDLCDETGKICARIKGFSARSPEGADGVQSAPAAPGTLLLAPGWKEETVDRKPLTAAYEVHQVMLCEFDESKKADIETRMRGVRCMHLPSKGHDIAQRFQTCARQVFVEIRTMIENKIEADVLLQIVVPTQGDQRLFTALSGLLKTARLEHPKIIGQLIEMEPGAAGDLIANRLNENASHPADIHIRYRNGARLVAKWKEIDAPDQVPEIPWEEKGVYLITGGAGGLGLIFADEIVKQTRQVTLILAGRSKLDPARQKQIDELCRAGADIAYYRVDVAKEEEVARLLKKIGRRCARLDGIIHGAGIVRDNYMIKKRAEEFEQVLLPKVAGLVNLDHASRHFDLDFLVLFSSVSSSLGNPGQCDYAAANGFMDAYAAYRNRLVSENKRQGHTVSINWPLWKEGGMHVDAMAEQTLRQSMGMTAMSTRSGIRAFYQALSFGTDQVIVMEGERERMKQSFGLKRPSDPPPKTRSDKPVKTPSTITYSKDGLSAGMQKYLKDLISRQTRLAVEKIDAHENFDKYGIDSVMAVSMTDQLKSHFGELSNTLFFEYISVAEMADYFAQQHMDRSRKLLSRAEPAQTRAVEVKAPGSKEKPEKKIDFPRSRWGGAKALPSKSDTRAEIKAIAVIGISGRYPMADNVAQYWRNLKEGRDCITPIPGERWDHSLYFDPEKLKPGKSYAQSGGFINDVDKFDPLFFDISPREAETIDPQERLFMEIAWEVLEDAGYTREALKRQFNRRIGVFAGCMYQHYPWLARDCQYDGLLNHNAYWSIANRVSYFLDSQGPSIAIDSACSSSLSAIYLACESLKKGECKMAIAGGVNLNLHPDKFVVLSQNQLLASDGKCRALGNGDGYLPGEGVGAVLLKPLALAEKDRDHIYAVIKGGMMNHCGKTSGYMVPNPKAQTDLIVRVFDSAGVHPETVNYMEIAANGSSLGDAIEITGLKKAFKPFTDKIHFCSIGTVKSNIGHLEAASGISQLTKLVCQMQHKTLAPSIHTEPANENIDLADSPFFIQKALTPWEKPAIEKNGRKKTYPRTATISSFGAGGANTTILVQEYEDRRHVPADSASGPAIVPLSAKTERQLDEYVAKLSAFLEKQNGSAFLGHQHHPVDFRNLAHTLQTGREPMQARLAIVANSLQELQNKLQTICADPFGDMDGVFRSREIKKPENRASLSATATRPNAPGIHHMIKNGEFDQIACAWVEGQTIDWRLFPQNADRYKISLPTYAFERRRCWVTPPGRPLGPPVRSMVTGCISHVKSEMATPVAPEPEAAPSTGDQIANDIKNELTAFFGLAQDDFKPDIPSDIPMDKFGFDSIKAVNFRYRLEKRYGIRIPMNEIGKSRTLDQLVDNLAKAVKAQKEIPDDSGIPALVQRFLQDRTDLSSTSDHALNELYKNLSSHKKRLTKREAESTL